MKTTIHANGILTITAESSVEAYALKNWWAHLGAFACDEDKTSGLGVDWSFTEPGEALLPPEQIK